MNALIREPSQLLAPTSYSHALQAALLTAFACLAGAEFVQRHDLAVAAQLPLQPTRGPRSATLDHPAG